MSKPHIVIVTYNWPPRNAIGTHRPYSWARYWSGAGAKVTILTAKKQLFDEPLDLSLAELDGVEVIETHYGGSGAGVVRKMLKFGRVLRIAKWGKSWLTRRVGAIYDPRAAWREAAESVALRLAHEADFVVSTFGPAASHLIAHDMKSANPSLRWVADYRDLWSQSHLGDITEKLRKTIREKELATVGSGADLLTAVSEDMVAQLSRLTGKLVFNVPNGFDVDESTVLEHLRPPVQKLEGPLRIVHTGMIYRGHRDPTPLLAALAALHARGDIEEGDATVDFYGARVEVALELSRNPVYAPFIRLMGHVPREVALEAQRSAGLLLLLESPAPEARGVLTGKLFEYLAAGRPILCIGSRPEYEIARVIEQTGTGCTLGPEAYHRIGPLVSATLMGGGLYSIYEPCIESILRFSRKRIAIDLYKKMLAFAVY